MAGRKKVATENEAVKTSTESTVVIETTETPKTAEAEEITPAEEKKYTESDVDRIVKDAIAAYAKNAAEATEKEAKYVTVMYLGAIASGTTVSLGKLGTFNKPGVPRNIPRDIFLENLGRPVVDHLISARRLIVLDGLTDEERERYGLDYSESEVLSKNAFFKLLDYNKATICDIFSKMCVQHKRLIAKIYHTAYFENHDARVRAETVKALNVLSKKDEKSGMFALILEDMGRKFAENEE